jgi:hypothetical protein
MRFFALLAAGVAAADLTANPIRRVVTLLPNMQKELEAEGAKEAALYKKFECYCNTNSNDGDAEVSAAKAKIEELNAAIENQTAEKERTDAELADHKSDRANAQAAVQSATAIREKENAAYKKEAGETGENIAALNRAIPALEKGMGASLLQSSAGRSVAVLRKMALTSSSIDSYQKKELLSFLSMEKGDYAPQSGEIVGILKQMKDQMDADLNGINSTEEAAQKAFDELKAAKQAEIAAASSAIEVKTKRSGDLAVAVTESKQDLKDTNAALSEKQQFLANLAVNCKTKAAEWDERQKVRAEEATAISEVISMLNDDDALDLFKKTLPSPGAKALIQTQEKHSSVARARALVESAQKAGAAGLDTLAFMLKGKKVSFDKVLVMIDNMVEHLEKEQKDDDAHLDFCRTKFDETDDKIKGLNQKIEGLGVSIDEAKSAAAQLAEEISATEEAIKETDKAVADATEQRKAENKQFVQEQSDFNDALELLGRAENRLQKFYNPALYKAEATPAPTEEERIANAISFLQQEPETWSGDYKAKSQKNNGVVALIGMLKKDLETDLQEGRHDEETSQRDYEKLMKDSAAQRAADVKSVTNKSAAKADLESEIVDSQGDHDATTGDLGEAQAYLASLHGSCDFLTTNFDFRKAARAQERDALRNAKAALKGAKVELIQKDGFLARK